MVSVKWINKQIHVTLKWVKYKKWTENEQNSSSFLNKNFLRHSQWLENYRFKLLKNILRNSTILWGETKKKNSQEYVVLSIKVAEKKSNVSWASTGRPALRRKRFWLKKYERFLRNLQGFLNTGQHALLAGKLTLMKSKFGWILVTLSKCALLHAKHMNCTDFTLIF